MDSAPHSAGPAALRRRGAASRASLIALTACWLLGAWLGATADPGTREAGQRPPGEGVARLLWGERLDANLAPSRALRALPRIGVKRAQAIIAGRPYCDVEEIRRVRGIGPVTWAAIRDSLEVRARPMECGAGAASAGPGG